ncbi:hypothetical protein Nepgr_003947 [Nepenthes gracilis]|uniref:Uncharacterized protein n=1 Tax=Nepenthes gracilis TaxID=150966 RepID=A0AAD3S0F8_NEPGR|nr:hypothetical protein Nepgr_003947 [Nepenthes gracilis]
MVVVEMFFAANSSMHSSTSNHHSDTIILLSGPPSCGKTSLLFQFALNSISTEDDGMGSRPSVVFICCRRRLESRPPCLLKGIDRSSGAFHRIQMKYVDDDEGIKKYFAAFHLHDTLPAAVIIDDFGDFFDERNCQQRYGNARGRDMAMVRVLALCQSAMLHANKKAHCKLLLSDMHLGDSSRLLYIYKRWVSSLFTIQGDGSGSFLLKNSIPVEDCRVAKYSIALQYLVLNGITEGAGS